MSSITSSSIAPDTAAPLPGKARVRARRASKNGKQKFAKKSRAWAELIQNVPEVVVPAHLAASGEIRIDLTKGRADREACGVIIPWSAIYQSLGPSGYKGVALAAMTAKEETLSPGGFGEDTIEEVKGESVVDDCNVDLTGLAPRSMVPMWQRDGVPPIVTKEVPPPFLPNGSPIPEVPLSGKEQSENQGLAIGNLEMDAAESPDGVASSFTWREERSDQDPAVASLNIKQDDGPDLMVKMSFPRSSTFGVSVPSVSVVSGNASQTDKNNNGKRNIGFKGQSNMKRGKSQGGGGL